MILTRYCWHWQLPQGVHLGMQERSIQAARHTLHELRSNICHCDVPYTCARPLGPRTRLSMMLSLRSPNGSEQQLVDHLILGRGSHDCLSDPLISRQQLRLDCVCPGVVQLTNLGLNPIIVEKQVDSQGTQVTTTAAATANSTQPPWQVTDLVETGDSTCLQHNCRFYLASLQDTTTFTIIGNCAKADDTSAAVATTAAAGPAAAVPGWQQQQQQQQQVHSSPSELSRAQQEAADAALAAALAAEEEEQQQQQTPADGSHLGSPTAEALDFQRPIKKPRLDSTAASDPQDQATAAAAAGPSSSSSFQVPSIGDGPFSLFAVRGLSPAYNTGFLGASLRKLVVSAGSSNNSTGGDAGSSSSSRRSRINRLTFALASNYMVDMGWLLSACPDLTQADKVLVVHGHQGDRAAAVTAEAAAAGLTAPRFCAHAPPLPLAFGTHHSKGFLLGYEDGSVRVIIHTANYIYADCNNKTQGVWCQDFPPKDVNSPENSQFEDSLIDYVRCLSLPGSWLSSVMSVIKSADFSSSRVALVASVPGYHTGALKLHAYGHMRLRALLQQQQQHRGSSSCVMQCSSLGSLDEKWLLQEFMASMTAAAAAAAAAAGGQGNSSSSSNAFARMVSASRAQAAAAGSSNAGADQPPLYIVWPSVCEVQHSREGWAAGYSIPGPAKNVTKSFLSRHWCRFGGEPVGRQSAMPHIKSYGMFTTPAHQQQRQPGQQQQQQGRDCTELSWWLVTSHNLSKAAWGSLQVCQRGQYRGQQQLMIRSYELGVLATPQLEQEYLKHRHRGYSCTAHQTRSSADDAANTQQQQQQQQQQQDNYFTVKFYAWQPGQDGSQQWDAGSAATNTNSSSSSGGGGSDSSTRVVHVPLPVPYRLPPQQYTSDDAPWCVDVQFSGQDVFGFSCGEAPFKAYGNRQPAD